MSTHASNAWNGLHYALPEDSQLRLSQLRDHIRFLGRLAHPRAADETREWRPEVRMGELAFCLELLAGQLDQVLGEVSWQSPQAGQAAHSGDASGTDEAGPLDDAEGPWVFGVTLAQIDALNRLVQTIAAHGDAVAASDMADFAEATLAVLGHAIFDGATEVRGLLDEVEEQRLRPERGRSAVREARAVYGAGPALPSPAVTADARLH